VLVNSTLVFGLKVILQVSLQGVEFLMALSGLLLLLLLCWLMKSERVKSAEAESGVFVSVRSGCRLGRFLELEV